MITNEFLGAYQDVKDGYKPDILTCLANLSNDEVFTPPSLANEILDMLPQELFEESDTRFLDPACKSGVFLREIARRLMKGLEKQIPNEQERRNHIFTKQVFGIAITELTSQMSRRSTYCSKTANGKYSVCSIFKSENGNISFKPILHTFKNGNCVYCGASEKEYGEIQRQNLESHAYEFIHLTDKQIKEMEEMKFDVIIGNPPYQISDGGGTGDSAKPIYQLFIRQAKKLNPRFMSFIVPSRWMKGGKGLDDFRQEMINDKHITILHDYLDAGECFPGVNIDGGVCYFLRERDRESQCKYYTHLKDGELINSERYLKIENIDTVIRDPRQISIINKAQVGDRFSKIVLARNPFNIYANILNDINTFSFTNNKNIKNTDSYVIYGVKGKKGGAKRVYGFVSDSVINRNLDIANKYKLFFSKAYMTTSTTPPEIILAKPGDVCTETFLNIGSFNTEKEAKNCLDYIKSKFFRALLFFNRHSLNISQASFEFIPMQDFSKPWTDAELYKKYNLTKEEIDFIESMIKPMD